MSYFGYRYIPYKQSNEDKVKVKYSHQRIKQILLRDYHIALDYIWAGYKGNRYRGYVERYNMRNIDTNEIIAEGVTLNAIRIQLQAEGYSLHDEVKPNQGAVEFLEFVESIKEQNK